MCIRRKYEAQSILQRPYTPFPSSGHVSLCRLSVRARVLWDDGDAPAGSREAVFSGGGRGDRRGDGGDDGASWQCLGGKRRPQQVGQRRRRQRKR